MRPSILATTCSVRLWSGSSPILDATESRRIGAGMTKEKKQTPERQIVRTGGAARRSFAVRVIAPRSKPNSLSLSGSEHISYLVNTRFEVEWVNTSATQPLESKSALASEGAVGGGVFAALYQDVRLTNAAGFDDLLRFHVSIAKQRIAKPAATGCQCPSDGQATVKVRGHLR